MTNWLLEIAGHTVMIGIILYLRMSGLTTGFLVLFLLSFVDMFIWMPGKYLLSSLSSIYGIGSIARLSGYQLSTISDIIKSVINNISRYFQSKQLPCTIDIEIPRFNCEIRWKQSNVNSCTSSYIGVILVREFFFYRKQKWKTKRK